MSLLLALGTGWLIRQHAVWRGALITFAQRPAMLLHGEAGPLLPVGVAMLVALSVPAMLAAAVGGWLARRRVL